MRRLALLAAVVFLISWSGMSAEAAEPTWSTGAVQASHYVGPSKSKNDGDTHGIVGMNYMCQQTYGNTAHMCNVDEFFGSSAIAKGAAAAPQMWIHPSVHDCLVESSGGAVTCREADLGRDQESTLLQACSPAPGVNSWTMNSEVSGMSVEAAGGVNNAFLMPQLCSKSLPVACCAP
jgi:hypothetical protein